MEEMLTERQAAEILGLTPSALRKWRQLSKGPRFFKLSERCVRYTRADLQDWLMPRQVQPATRREPVAAEQ